jgi:uncharacterized protein (DUF1810 family)
MKKKQIGLERFAFDQSRNYSAVLEELNDGRKKTHWMWFIFPQIVGLGRSSVSKKYALANQEEAEEYLQHTVLGNNLRECTEIMISHYPMKIYTIFDGLDIHKFHACMTLFSSISPDGSIFHNALDAYFDGRKHQPTIDLL